MLLEGKAKGSAWWEGGTPTTSPRLQSEGGASLCQGWGARPVPTHPPVPPPRVTPCPQKPPALLNPSPGCPKMSYRQWGRPETPQP